MVLTRITWILETHNKLHPMQTGFRPNLSTQDSLALIHHDIIAPLTSGPRTIVAADVQKAFDTIPHHTVIRAAERLGFTGRILNFVKSFLKDRQFQVMVGATSGPITHNATGVPQGAVLSPTLFNISMAELAFRLDEVEGLGFTIYADDITFWKAGAPLAAQQNTLQHALDVTA